MQDFCDWLTIAPDISGVSNPIPFLQMFANCVRVGALAANGSGVNKRTMEGYLRNLMQIFSGIGPKDPHLDVLVKIDFKLSQKLRVYAHSDPPPDRYHPIPISLMHKFWRHFHDGNTHQREKTDLLYLVFFFPC